MTKLYKVDDVEVHTTIFTSKNSPEGRGANLGGGVGAPPLASQNCLAPPLPQVRNVEHL